MSDKRLYVTIDTEMDADIHWVKSGPAQFTSILEGIPKYYRPLWDRYDVHPIYLLSPEVVMDDECCKVFNEEIRKGAIIGAHLHPECIEPQKSFRSDEKIRTNKFPCKDCTYEIEREKLASLTELIKDRLGVKPEWYRAARFGADEDTYRILDELGYKYDTSVTPGINWGDRGGIDFRRHPGLRYKIKDTGLEEFPVTISGKRFGVIGKILPDNWLFYRWIRPTHMTYLEMRSLINEQLKNGNKDLVMMFHSMEIMIKKTPYVRMRWMQKYYLLRLNYILHYCFLKGIEM